MKSIVSIVTITIAIAFPRRVRWPWLNYHE